MATRGPIATYGPYGCCIPVAEDKHVSLGGVPGCMADQPRQCGGLENEHLGGTEFGKLQEPKCESIEPWWKTHLILGWVLHVRRIRTWRRLIFDLQQVQEAGAAAAVRCKAFHSCTLLTWRHRLSALQHEIGEHSSGLGVIHIHLALLI